MEAGPRIDHYEWRGGREALLRFGPGSGPVVALALPLFEEANRTRAFGGAILRALARRGIGGVLPELPGQGDSLIPTDQATLADLRAAFAAAAGGAYAVAIRSGALLLDAASSGRWLLAPQSGPDLLRELARIRGGPLDGERVEVAGNGISGSLLRELSIAAYRTEQSSRVVRLGSDSQAAARHIAGSPIWRRTEPDQDFGLAELITADIGDWIATCEG